MNPIMSDCNFKTVVCWPKW